MSVYKVAIFAVCLSFRLHRNPSDGFKEGRSDSARRLASRFPTRFTCGNDSLFCDSSSLYTDSNLSFPQSRKHSGFGISVQERQTADSGYPNIGHRQVYLSSAAPEATRAGMTMCEFLNICLNFSVLGQENDVALIRNAPVGGSRVQRHLRVKDRLSVCQYAPPFIISIFASFSNSLPHSSFLWFWAGTRNLGIMAAFASSKVSWREGSLTRTFTI